MQISNPLQMTDWEIERFLKVVLATQLVLWGVIGLDAVGLQIPILRQFIGFIYLTFVPGILILRILKLHKLGNIETLLYTVGLSIATLMFTGFFMNMIYPLFGISRPISIVPLIITISVVVLVLCVLSYIRDKDFSDPSFIDAEEILSPPVLFLCLIPFMAVLGTYLVNFHHSNILLMLMIVVIAIVALLIGFDKFIPKNLYPLAIWVMAIALVWHYTLITNYAGVHDGEFCTAKLVIENHFWEWSGYGNYSSILSVTILPPIIHFLGNISLTWLYKIIFPVFLSLLPLGVYAISKKYLNDKKSFLAAFLFLTTHEFFMTLSSITKQLMAVFFLVLLFMVILNRDMDRTKRSFLSIIFAISLIVSHYGTSYLVMFSFIFVLFFLYLTENQAVKELWKKFYYFISKGKDWISDNSNVERISLNFVLLFITFALAWYIYVSSSSAFNAIMHIGDHIAGTIFTEFLNPEYSRGGFMLAKEYSGLKIIHKYLKLSIPFLIIIGLFKALLSCRKSKFGVPYLGFSIYYLAILIASVVIAHFAVMGPGRLYILALPVLALLSIIGGLTILGVIKKILKLKEVVQQFKTGRKRKSNRALNPKRSEIFSIKSNYGTVSKEEDKNLKILFVYFIILMLFNTQFIVVLANDHPTSISIGQEYVNKYGNRDDKAKFYSGKIMEYDISSLKWLSEYGCKHKKLYFTGGYSHIGSVIRSSGYFPIDNIYNTFSNRTASIPNDQYILLIYANVVNKIGFGTIPGVVRFEYFNMTDVYPLLKDKDKIYTNGDSEILWS